MVNLEDIKKGNELMKKIGKKVHTGIVDELLKIIDNQQKEIESLKAALEEEQEVITTKLRGYNITVDQFNQGEFYYEYLEETGDYHIFHTESDFSPYSFASEEEANEKVNEMNSDK
jgi:hypothetical protein